MCKSKSGRVLEVAISLCLAICILPRCRLMGFVKCFRCEFGSAASGRFNGKTHIQRCFVIKLRLLLDEEAFVRTRDPMYAWFDSSDVLVQKREVGM
jgi:hypothetical protein